MDGQSEKTIQKSEDMLRACALDFDGSWDDHLPLIWEDLLKATPFEALYGHRCRTPSIWEEVRKALMIGPDLINVTTKKVKEIRECLIAAQNRQKSYANK